MLGSSRQHDGDVRRPAQEGSVPGKVPELIAKYELDLRTLVGAVSAKYLDLAQAQSLFEHSVMGGKRTELGWETDVEEANRSLDLALAYMEADDEEDATKKQKLKEALEESRKKKSERKGPHQDSD